MALRGKKGEYHQMKEGNNKIRAQMVRDQKVADSFKVTDIKKRTEFLPALHGINGFSNPTSIEIGAKYMDGIEK